MYILYNHLIAPTN